MTANYPTPSEAVDRLLEYGFRLEAGKGLLFPPSSCTHPSRGDTHLSISGLPNVLHAVIGSPPPRPRSGYCACVLASAMIKAEIARLEELSEGLTDWLGLLDGANAKSSLDAAKGAKAHLRLIRSKIKSK